MESVLKALTAIAPFLASYPIWTRVLVAGWVILTAATFLALVLTPQIKRNNAAAESASTDDTVVLSVDRIELFGFDDSPNRAVQVFAHVNGTTFRYPSLAGVDWLQVGPDMSPQRFTLPPTSNMYEITFDATLNDGVRLVSQDTDSVKASEIASERRRFSYALHKVGAEKTRSAGIAATVWYTLYRR
jgi:hypothetical protein